MNDVEFEGILKQLVANEEWQQIPYAFGVPNGEHWQQRAYAMCKDLIPKEQLWNVLIDVYRADGFDFPKRFITEALPFRPADYLSQLPPKYRQQDIFTVYRASTLPPKLSNFVQLELSWTTNPLVAEQFYNMRGGKLGKCYVYKAAISRRNVLAYIPFEEEILQLCGVRDICLYL